MANEKEVKPGITIYVPSGMTLPDNDQWEHRFEVHSETSDRVYIVSQNKKKRHWACSCMAWKRYRHCKHLSAIGVPNHEVPFEAQLKAK